MKYGHFDDQAREYVITRPDTPLPWINYIGCQDYFGILSATAGGYSYYRDARKRRITRGRYNNVPMDFGGRYIYLRDDRSGDYWSPSWMPTQSALDSFECRHGMGYSTISSKNAGIAASTRYFVPLDETLEIWQLTLTNERSEAAEMSVFSSVEFCLWEANDDATNFQRNFNTGQVEVEDEVIYHKTEYRERRNHFAWFACSENLAGFDTQREDFLGPWRGWDRPQVVEAGKSDNSIAHGWSPIGSHHVKVALKPGESRQIVFVLGYFENPQDEKFDPPGSQTINKRLVKPMIAKYRDPAEADAAFAKLGAYWDGLLGIYQVATPDEHTNRMVNVWNAYQCMATFNMSRSASTFESGIGRGLGFRDSNQDLLGFVHMVPERARQRILDLAATQLESGGAYHQYQPLTKKGNDASAAISTTIRTGWSSALPNTSRKPATSPSSTSWCLRFDARHRGAALRASQALDPVRARPARPARPAADRPGRLERLPQPQLLLDQSGPVLPDHDKQGRQDRRIRLHRRPVGACRQGTGRHRRAAGSGRGRRDLSRQRPPEMEQTVREHGWDGEWFLRAYDDFGRKVGSKECEEGKIFIEPQGYCVLAGIGLDDGKARKALDSVAKHLATPHGIVLHQPAYTHYYIEYGEISTYPPGYKENAGIFCHNNPWVIIAETMLGNGDGAFDYYGRINPSAREEISEVHRCEPYVYAQMIAGRDAPTHGEAKNSWLTGTAAWNYYAVTQWILGIRPDYDGLRVAPVVPESWQGFSVSRRFRGVTYDITVKRGGPGNAVSLTVDGKAIDGDLVPPPAKGTKTVTVEAVIG